MEKVKGSGVDITCSFCRKPQDQVERIILGSYCAICSECVDLCSVILAKLREQKKGDSNETKLHGNGKKRAAESK